MEGGSDHLLFDQPVAITGETEIPRPIRLVPDNSSRLETIQEVAEDEDSAYEADNDDSDETLKDRSSEETLRNRDSEETFKDRDWEAAFMDGNREEAFVDRDWEAALGDIVPGEAFEGRDWEDTLKDRAPEEILQDRAPEETLQDRAPEEILEDKGVEVTMKDKSPSTSVPGLPQPRGHPCVNLLMGLRELNWQWDSPGRWPLVQTIYAGTPTVALHLPHHPVVLLASAFSAFPPTESGTEPSSWRKSTRIDFRTPGMLGALVTLAKAGIRHYLPVSGLDGEGDN